MGALDGFVVLDLTQGLSGPSCTMQLGDAGARVIKAEPLSGDCARGYGPPFVNGESPAFLSLNRNKESIALDAASTRGRRILQTLARKADVVVVEDVGAGSVKDLGVTYQSLRRRKPGVIYCEITAFGDKGPLAGLPGAELPAQAMSDYWGSFGVIGNPPIRVGADIASVNAGTFAFEAILAALYHREMTGEGQRVSVSKLGALLHMRGIIWAAISDPDEWIGFHCDTYIKPPEQGYKTKDGRIYFMLRRGSQEDFDKLALDLGVEEAFTDPRFGQAGRNATGTGKWAYLVKHIWERAFKDKTNEELIALIRGHNGEAVPVNTYDSLMRHPQIHALNPIAEVQHPTAGAVKMPNIPWHMEATPGSIRLPPPLPGQHTDCILEWAGLSPTQVARLRKANIVK